MPFLHKDSKIYNSRQDHSPPNSRGWTSDNCLLSLTNGQTTGISDFICPNYLPDLPHNLYRKTCSSTVLPISVNYKSLLPFK